MRSTWTDLFVRIFVAPREAFRSAMSLQLSWGEVAQAFALLLILRVLVIAMLGEASFVIPVGDARYEVSPATYGLILGAIGVLSAAIFHYGGRALGGTGVFYGACIAVLLTEVIGVTSTLVQLVLFQVVPYLAAVAAAAGAVIAIVCGLVFVDELHGFESIPRAIGAVLLGVFGFTVLISVLAAMSGIGSTLSSLGRI